MRRFQVKLTKQLNEEEMRAIRLAYTPVLGAEATMLYLTLVEEYNLQTNYFKKSEFQLTVIDLSSLTKLTLKQIETSFVILQDFSLLERYSKNVEDEKRAEHMIVLHPPLTLENVRSSDILYWSLIRQVGATRAKHIILSEKYRLKAAAKYPQKSVSELSRSNPFKPTTNEQGSASTRRGEEVSPLANKTIKQNQRKGWSWSNKQENPEGWEPFEVSANTVKVLEAFRAKLKAARPPRDQVDTTTYITQLTRRKPSKMLLDTLELAKESGFSDKALNTICHYAYTQNGKINIAFVSTIITNFYRQETLDAESIKNHLERATAIKKRRLAEAEAKQRAEQERLERMGEVEMSYLELSERNDPANWGLKVVNSPVIHDLTPAQIKEKRRRFQEEEDLKKILELEDAVRSAQVAPDKLEEEDQEALKKEMIDAILKNVDDKEREGS